jgi:hypothetical protein
MLEENHHKVTVPPRLAGICKKCHEFRYGYLLHGQGPFICYQCGEAAKTIPATTTTTNLPSAEYFSYTFTTSNSTASVSTTGDLHPNYSQGDQS